MLSTSLTFIEDPGHGWLVVPIDELRELGIYEKISQFSFLAGDHAYLEEDMDYGTYVLARREQGYPDPEVNVRYVDRFNRNKRRFPSHD